MQRPRGLLASIDVKGNGRVTFLQGVRRQGMNPVL